MMNIRLKVEYGRTWIINSKFKDEARLPEIFYGQDVPLTLELYHEDGSLYTLSELASYVNFQFAMDIDYDHLTNPGILQTSGFTIDGNTISFTVNTNTARADEILNNEAYKDVIAELKGFRAGETKASFVSQFNSRLKNTITDDNASPPAESQSNFYNITQTNSLLSAKIDKLFTDSRTLEVLNQKYSWIVGPADEITVARYETVIKSATAYNVIRGGIFCTGTGEGAVLKLSCDFLDSSIPFNYEQFKYETEVLHTRGCNYQMIGWLHYLELADGIIVYSVAATVSGLSAGFAVKEVIRV
jgi:hypothetical protein